MASVLICQIAFQNMKIWYGEEKQHHMKQSQHTNQMFFDQNGSNTLFTDLFLKHRKHVYHYFRKQTRDSDLAEDLTQETFIKAFLALQQGRYTDNNNFQGWILRIARNLYFDTFRKKKTVVYNKMSLEQTRHVKSKNILPDESLILFEDSQIIRKAIKELKPVQKDVLILRYYGNLSFREIAETMNCNVNTVLGRMRYALENIRKQMAIS